LLFDSVSIANDINIVPTVEEQARKGDEGGLLMERMRMVGTEELETSVSVKSQSTGKLEESLGRGWGRARIDYEECSAQ
jgi:hypothetical protein